MFSLPELVRNVGKEKASDEQRTILQPQALVCSGEMRRAGIVFFSLCNSADAEGLFSSKTDNYQDMWSCENTPEKGPDTKRPVAIRQYKGSMFVASSGLSIADYI